MQPLSSTRIGKFQSLHYGRFAVNCFEFPKPNEINFAIAKKVLKFVNYEIRPRIAMCIAHANISLFRFMFFCPQKNFFNLSFIPQPAVEVDKILFAEYRCKVMSLCPVLLRNWE